jgi:glutamine amidotransferase/cyclase
MPSLFLSDHIDKDGTNSGFDYKLIGQMRGAVSIPVIASSGAGSAQHFVDVFPGKPM